MKGKFFKNKFINKGILPTNNFFRNFFIRNLSLLPSNLFLFNKGREALKFALIAKKNNTKLKKILVPPSICESVLEVIRNENISIKYYLLNTDLRIDFNNLLSQIDQEIDAIYINYFFGYVYQVKQIEKICIEKNILFILDCAHVFYDIKSNIYKNLKADITLISQRKFLPIPDGGGILLKDHHSYLKYKKNIKNFFIEQSYDLNIFLLRKLIYSSINLAKIRFYIKRIKKHFYSSRHLEENEKVHKNNLTEFKSISIISKFLMYKFNYYEINRKRIKNLNYYFKNLEQFKNVKPLLKKSVLNISPYSFPVIVPNRSELVSKAKEIGITLEPTLGDINLKYDSSILNDLRFEKLNKLITSTISLPIHQDLEPKDIFIIMQLVNSYSKDHK